ncbi:MAG: hypothetical protein LBN43_09625 [Oscillospiraceae bacterium]|jgi:hypothetical protein|nr:hypothetical protein [Oscillospiraceae bacterium]
MIFVIAGFAALTAYELPGLIKRRDAKEIAAVTLITAAALYYFVCYALSVNAWSPMDRLVHWLESGLGLSYSRFG